MATVKVPFGELPGALLTLGSRARPLVASASPNGTAPSRPASLVSLVDELAGLREQIKRATTREREITSILTATLTAQGGRFAEGTAHVAALDYRQSLVPDVALFVEAVGAPRAYAALSVGVEKARGLMAGDDLAAISETKSTAALSIRPRQNGDVQ
jgi:hypothetical protein